MLINRIKILFDEITENTNQLKKECAMQTGLSLKTIRALYNNPNKEMKLDTAMKLKDFFSNKLGPNIQLDDILDSQSRMLNKVSQDMLRKALNIKGKTEKV